MLASGLAVSSELTPRLVLRWLFHRRQDVFCGSASSSVFFPSPNALSAVPAPL